MKGIRWRKSGREEGKVFIDSKPRALLTGVSFLCGHEEAVVYHQWQSPVYSQLLQQLTAFCIWFSVIILSQEGWKDSEWSLLHFMSTSHRLVSHELLDTFEPGPAGPGELLLSGNTLLLTLKTAYKIANTGQIYGLLSCSWKYKSDIKQKYYCQKSKCIVIINVVDQ